LLRVLHIADAHLDTPFCGREESLRHRLRDATRDAFAAAAGLAIDREVHALLIAGDLFDDNRLSFTTERFLLDQMARLAAAGIPVFYATGNHDPGRANYRAHRLAWPQNVRLFRSSSPETIPIADAGWLTAAGHSTPRESDNFAAKFPAARNDLPHVAMLHTQVTSARDADRHDRYAPSTRDDLAAGAFDYWALGHVHARQRVFDDLPAWYPGNLQGRNPRETEPKGALVVEIEKGREPHPEFVPLAPIVWDTITIDCPRDAATLDELTRALHAAASERLDLGDGREHFVRLDVAGESPLARELRDGANIDALGEDLCDALGVAWLEVRPRGIVRPVDLAAWQGGPTALGEALAMIDQARTDDALIDGICPDALAATPGDEADARRTYLRGLLDGAEGEVASLLVPETER
jgi:DNA repair exonuclease SbcCD nuclease subunit